MITLRPLTSTDAPLMLEWMHDYELVKDLHKDFSSMTIENCENFIKSAQNNGDNPINIHLAIANENNEYMGTVSLKDIDHNLKVAEFGIVIRRCATGKGYSIDAMKQILEKGFKELGLKQIYWCVDTKNQRALRFYDKNGFNRVNLKDYKKLYEHVLNSGDYEQDKIDSYVWYIAEEQ